MAAVYGIEEKLQTLHDGNLFYYYFFKRDYPIYQMLSFATVLSVPEASSWTCTEK